MISIFGFNGFLDCIAIPRILSVLVIDMKW
jgi:hypothetical protein